MNARWAGHKRLAVALAVAIGAASLCSTAMAQRLNLDRGGAFTPETERSVERLIETLRDELKASIERVDQLEEGPALVLRAQNRVREFAVALLEAGSGLGEAGSSHVLAGRRILARVAELDQVIAALGETEPAALTAFLARCPSGRSAIRRNVDELDALLARAFAPLDRNSKGGTGWLIVGASQADAPAFNDAIEGCSKVEGVSAEAIATLRALASPAESGAAERDAERTLVAQAAQLLVAAPRWLTPKGANAAAALFDDAARRLPAPDPGVRANARADLCRLALLADSLGRIDKADVTARDARSLRALGVELAEGFSPGSSASDDVIGALRRTLLLVREYDAARWHENKRVVREVRPLWRSAATRARAARDALIATVTSLKPTAAALSDPAVLSAMSELRRSLDDALDACVISEWLVGSPAPGVSGIHVWSAQPAESSGQKSREPVTRRDDRTRRQAGVRLLAIGQDREKESGVEHVRELGAALRSWMPISGEDELRAALAAPRSAGGERWRRFTGGAAGDIASAIDQARDEWLRAWAGVKEQPAKGAPQPEIDLTRIDHLRRLVEILSATAAVEQLAADRSRGLRAWPGFEISDAALKALLAALESDLKRAGGFVTAGAYAELDQALVVLRPHATVATTLAQLHREASAVGLTAGWPVADLVARPAAFPTLGEDLTPGVWRARDRESIAILCRAVEEFAGAARSDRDRAAAMIRRAAAEAERIVPASP